MTSSEVTARFATSGADPDFKKPATAILLEMPSQPGTFREAAILATATEGHVPYYIQHWAPVAVKHGNLSGKFYTLPDYFSVGSDTDFVRVRINPLTAESIGDWLEGQLPTPKMVDDIYKAAPQKLSARPWGPPYDGSMLAVSRWPAQDARIGQQMANRGYVLDQLTAGHLKDVVVGKGLAGYPKRKGRDGKWKPEVVRGSRVGIYGWFQADGAPIQGPGANFVTHEVSYADYSHGIRYVHREMLVEGKSVAVSDVLRDPRLAPLISGEGALEYATYRDARAGA